MLETKAMFFLLLPFPTKSFRFSWERSTGWRNCQGLQANRTSKKNGQPQKDLFKCFHEGRDDISFQYMVSHLKVSLLGLLIGPFGENYCHFPLAWRADFATLTRASGLRVKNSSGETANHCEPKDQQPGEGLQKLRSERPWYQNQDDRSMDHWIRGRYSAVMVQLHGCHVARFFLIPGWKQQKNGISHENPALSSICYLQTSSIV